MPLWRLILKDTDLEAYLEKTILNSIKLSGNSLPTVAVICNDLGSGGGEAARLVAEIMKLPFFDQETIEAIVNRAFKDKSLLKAVDGLLPPPLLRLRRIFLPAETPKNGYFERLVKVLLRIAHSGGVICARGTPLILQGGTAYRVRVKASLDHCAKRISDGNSYGRSMEAAIVDRRKRMEFVNTFLRRFPESEEVFDLTIKADGLTPDDMARRIVEELGKKRAMDAA